MATLSVIILAKNEQQNIKECIETTVQFADEILVIDDYSTDDTAEIAMSMGFCFSMQMNVFPPN